VPHLSVVPMLAPVEDDRASVLDLLPHEWEVLMMIDATRDLRGIAAALGRSEFEIAKIAYGLVSTGVVELLQDQPARSSAEAALGAEPALERARSALAGRRPEEALSNARAALAADPGSTEARLLAARALNRLARYGDAVDELRRAVQSDPLTSTVHLDLGFAAVRVADFASAHASWEHYLRLAPTASDSGRARAALETLTRLMHLLEAHADG
jgi:tetratricopeptide (TPR) repeat protein